MDHQNPQTSAGIPTNENPHQLVPQHLHDQQPRHHLEDDSFELSDDGFSSNFTPERQQQAVQNFDISTGFDTTEDSEIDSDNTRGQFFYDYSSSTDSILLLTPSPYKYQHHRHAPKLATPASIRWKRAPRHEKSSKLSAPVFSEPQATPPSRAESRGRRREQATEEDASIEVERNKRRRRRSSSNRKRRSSSRFLRAEFDEELEDGNRVKRVGIRPDGDLGNMNGASNNDQLPSQDLLEFTPEPILDTLDQQNNSPPTRELENSDPEIKQESIESDVNKTKEQQEPPKSRSSRRSLGSNTSSYSQQTMLKTTRNLTLSDLESSEDDLAPPDLTFRLEPGEGVSVRVNSDRSFVGTTGGGTGVDADGDSFFVNGDVLNEDDELGTPPELLTFRLGDNDPKAGGRDVLLGAEEQRNILGDLEYGHAGPEQEDELPNEEENYDEGGVLENNAQEYNQEYYEEEEFPPEILEKSILSKPRRVIPNSNPYQEDENEFPDYPEEEYEGEVQDQYDEEVADPNYYEGEGEDQAYEPDEALGEDQYYGEEGALDVNQYYEPEEDTAGDQYYDEEAIPNRDHHYEEEEIPYNEQYYEKQGFQNNQDASALLEEPYNAINDPARLHEQQDVDKDHLAEIQSKSEEPQSQETEQLYPTITDTLTESRRDNPSSPTPAHRSLPPLRQSPLPSPPTPPQSIHATQQLPVSLHERGVSILKRKADDTSFAGNHSYMGHFEGDSTIRPDGYSHTQIRVLANPRPRKHSKKRRRIELDWTPKHWSRLYQSIQKANSDSSTTGNITVDNSSGSGNTIINQKEQETNVLPNVPLSVRNEFPEFSQLELARRMLALSRIQKLKK